MLRHRNRVCCWLIGFAALAATVSAGEIPHEEPEKVGLSSEKLAEVSSTMKKFVDEGKVAGVITVVARDGKIAYFESTGKRDVKSGEPMELDTIVRIYSMTKPITSVATMMLAEEGKLALDDPIAKHLPELQDAKVFAGEENGELQVEEAKRPPTIRDLLRHTSGLTYGIFGNTPIDQRYRAANVLSNDITLAEMVTRLGEIPLQYQPGTEFQYSVSSDVLGRVVEVASGQAFDEYLQEHIFAPLDMKDTGFYVPESKLNRFAANHRPERDGALAVSDAPADSPYRNDPTMLSGGGGLVSTARDYIRFCQMLLNGGELDGKRLLQEETVEAMTQNQLPEEAYPLRMGLSRAGVGFGLGFSVVVESTGDPTQSRQGEYGWGGAASTHFWISPHDDMAVVVLTQLMPFSGQMENALKSIIYQAVREPVAAE